MLIPTIAPPQDRCSSIASYSALPTFSIYFNLIFTEQLINSREKLKWKKKLKAPFEDERAKFETAKKKLKFVSLKIIIF
jgi:hypothetical protein